MPHIVYISEHAFLQLLVSSVELYTKDVKEKKNKKVESKGEAFGYLFGSRVPQADRIVHRIEFVVPCQHVEGRKHNRVDPSGHSTDRILSMLRPFPGLQLLGTFHSHLYGSGHQVTIPADVAPSETDHASWEGWWNQDNRDTDALELIVGLKELKKRGWQDPRTLDNCVIGTWETFRYALGAWHTTQERATEHPKESLQAVEWLICPTAFGITREDLAHTRTR